MAEMKWFNTTLTIANRRLYIEVSGETQAAARHKLSEIIENIRQSKLPTIIGPFKPCTKEDEA